MKTSFWSTYTIAFWKVRSAVLFIPPCKTPPITFLGGYVYDRPSPPSLRSKIFLFSLSCRYTTAYQTNVIVEQGHKECCGAAGKHSDMQRAGRYSILRKGWWVLLRLLILLSVHGSAVQGAKRPIASEIVNFVDMGNLGHMGRSSDGYRILKIGNWEKVRHAKPTQESLWL